MRFGDEAPQDRGPWRVGRHQQRNIYRDEEYRAVALGDEEEAAQLACRICAALNAWERERKDP